MCSKILKYNRFYCITKGGFAPLGKLFCPTFVPKHDLCFPGSDLLAEAAHPLAHIGIAAGQPHADIGVNRDHRSALSTARTNRADAVAATLTVVPPARSSRIAGLFERTSAGATGTAGASFSAMIAGTNIAWTAGRRGATCRSGSSTHRTAVQLRQ